MAKILTSRGLVAALAAAVLGLGLAFGAATTTHAASVSDLTVGSATVAPGESVTIQVTATADGLGAYGVEVEYDSSLVSVDTCSSTNGVCNPDFGVSTVKINGSNLGGISGDDVILGSIVFIAGSDEGVADLTPTITALSDTTGTNLTVTATGGAITIAEATPTPSPSPSASAAPGSPTVTPKAVPATGGPAGDSSSSSMTLVLAAAGLFIVAGSAWAVARTRRIS